jgi:hypothetical protein
MTPNEIYYLETILRRLREFNEALADTASFSLSGIAFADEIDWLDCYIDAGKRAASKTENV